MDPSLIKTIDMLRTAQDALRSEMEVWALAKTLDEARLGHLRETACRAASRVSPPQHRSSGASSR
jgi:hypothetical protein